jgi:capsular exopolysaccharide synthesis family protein
MTDELVVLGNPKSVIAESIRTIRTNLQFSSVDDEVKTILVTSTEPGEGKSFISSNLALSFAQNDSKVLIVDCDMRKGRLHKIFGVTNEKGLSNLLIDEVEDEFKNYIRKTKVDNLYILTMGTVPPNPSELLDSTKNKLLVKILKEKFDYIIFDGVPITGLTDSLIMARLVDKVVIISAYKQTRMELLLNAKRSLVSVGADIAGVIVNKIPNVKNGYGYYGHYYE